MSSMDTNIILSQLSEKLDSLTVLVTEIKTNQARDAIELSAVIKRADGHEQLVQRGKGIFWSVQIFWGIIAAWIAKQHWGGK